MFRHLKQKLDSEKPETNSSSLGGDFKPIKPSTQLFDEPRLLGKNDQNRDRSGSFVPGNGDQQGKNVIENVSKWVIKSSTSSQDIAGSNGSPSESSSNLNSTVQGSPVLMRPNSMVSLNESKSQSGDQEKLIQENNRLREQIKDLTMKLESTTSGGQVDLIDEKLLKLVCESIAKESTEQSSGSNGVKSTSGNRSMLLPTPNQSISSEKHKQEIDLLQRRINELEESLREKNKTLRLQQQRINDIKKSFQRGSALDNKLFELPGGQNEFEESNPPEGPSTTKSLTTLRSENGFADQPSSQPPNPSHLHPFNHHQRQLSDSQASSSTNLPMNDISWQYLRSVIFKFVSTSDYEAQKHLVKAIAMLLQFSDAEEKQIRESLDQKVSWFKNLPLLGNGFKSNSHNNQPSHH